ncbi:hypothetical protein GDO86_001624, partial [Hymenochirus boettgeri]
VLGQVSVKQSANLVVTEGEPFQMNCSYTGTERNLQWYRQYSDQCPQVLALLFNSGYKTETHFTMFLDTKSKFSFLYRNATQIEDSAVYYCA